MLKDVTLRDWILSQGVVDRSDMHALILRVSNMRSLAQKLILHNATAHEKLMHVLTHPRQCVGAAATATKLDISL